MKRNYLNRIFNRNASQINIHSHRFKYPNNYHHHQISLFSTQQNKNILKEEEKEFLQENGYLWLKEFVPKNVAINIKNRVNYMLDNFDPNTTQSVFKTHRTEQQHKDLYFLNSGMTHTLFPCPLHASHSCTVHPLLNIIYALHTISKYQHINQNT